MKKLLSMLMCICIIASAMTTVAFAADMPEFVDTTVTPYVIHIDATKPTTTPVENDYGTLTLSATNWKASGSSTDYELGNGETLKVKHLYNSGKPASVTYSFNKGNISTGKYAVQYLVPHASVATTYDFTLTVGNAPAESVSVATGKKIQWITVKEFDYTTGDITLYTDTTNVDGYLRTVAVRLMPVYSFTEYAIRNTADNSNNDTFTVGGSSWSHSANNTSTIEGENSAAYWISKSEGAETPDAYVQYKFIKPASPISIYNSDNYTGVEPGWYDVYYCNPYAYRDDDPAALVTVYHNGTATEYTVDLTSQDGQKWNLINDVATPLYFTGDGSEYVQMNQVTDGKYIRTGAVMLRKKIEVSQPEVEVKPLVSGAAYADGALTIVTNGSSLDADKTVYAVVAAYSESGALLAGVKTTPVAITKGADDVTVPVNLPSDSGTSYKLLVIDSFATVKPIIASYDFLK